MAHAVASNLGRVKTLNRVAPLNIVKYLLLLLLQHRNSPFPLKNWTGDAFQANINCYCSVVMPNI